MINLTEDTISAIATPIGNGGVSNTGYGSEEEVAEKNKKALISKLERYKDLLAENEELDTLIKPQSSFPASEEMGFKKRSFIKYFWPFVVAAPVAGYLIYFISSMIAMSSINSYDTSFMTQAEVQAISNKIMSDTYMGMLVAIIVAAAIIISPTASGGLATAAVHTSTPRDSAGK